MEWQKAEGAVYDSGMLQERKTGRALAKCYTNMGVFCIVSPLVLGLLSKEHLAETEYMTDMCSQGGRQDP